MTKKYPYNFTENDLIEGCRRSIENVRGLLRSAAFLLNIKDNQRHALAIYMYAVEEFGKAILLRSYATGNKNKYQIPGSILGRGKPSIKSIAIDRILSRFLKQLLGIRSLKPDDTIVAHCAKLLIGSNNLPLECSHISRGIKISTPLPAGKIINLGSNRLISTPKNATGAFVNMTNFHYDPELRTFIEKALKTLCFYMDFDEVNKTWKYDIATDENQLRENIKRFEERLANYNCN